jgi:hypothetical protein
VRKQHIVRPALRVLFSGVLVAPAVLGGGVSTASAATTARSRYGWVLSYGTLRLRVPSGWRERFADEYSCTFPPRTHVVVLDVGPAGGCFGDYVSADRLLPELEIVKGYRAVAVGATKHRIDGVTVWVDAMSKTLSTYTILSKNLFLQADGWSAQAIAQSLRIT